jgi:zinc transporter, ZIP family
MAEAFAWGLVAASSLIIGAVLAILFRIPLRVSGLIMAFGAGVLISAVAFDLVEEAVNTSSNNDGVFAGLFAGCAVFFFGDAAIDRLGGGQRKSMAGEMEDSSGLSIVLGTVLDGIPESMVIGLTILQGGSVGAAYLMAVFISNLPEAIGSSTGLLTAGWKKARLLGLWVAVVVVSAIASAAGYGLLDTASASAQAFILTFAAGAILTMLADTMMPEAFRHGGKLAGVFTTLGFATAFVIHQLD